MALNGKTAVVTGAALGIGRAITEILVKNGAKVALLDVNEAEAKTLKKALDKQYGQENTLFVKCDVESEEQIKAALQTTADTFGGIDIVCNNAGILNEGEWEKTVSINLLGVIRVTYLVLKHMNKLSGGRGGVVVNTASMAGLGPFLTCPAYSATKHGVVGFTRSMALASIVSDYGIRFNAVCPGFVQTDLMDNIPNNLGQFSHLADIEKEMVEKMGTIHPSVVAECVLELVTDERKNGDHLLVKSNQKSYVTFPEVL
ncbi:15-hydroxyprostaglandin dehydrogenase [NAD(+)]-like isoform X2 [Amphiprion ocellaris]|uniref:15-hydroxyprostaglandin dehydrogenase [NAD(+)] n=1 Tax=Amphiprion ocellaris TaxID=80972 RepID=A0A3Q1ALT5_AMPOC|nr:15-hydroxyprostaglandin dehydrogenase [NAD(+)]-like isoform X2 [Amphiprion ocellaris]